MSCILPDVTSRFPQIVGLNGVEARLGQVSRLLLHLVVPSGADSAQETLSPDGSALSFVESQQLESTTHLFYRYKFPTNPTVILRNFATKHVVNQTRGPLSRGHIVQFGCLTL